SVLILWAWTALLSGFVLYPAYTGKGNAYVPFGLAALLLLLFTLLHPGVQRRRRGLEVLEEAHDTIALEPVAKHVDPKSVLTEVGVLDGGRVLRQRTASQRAARRARGRALDRAQRRGRGRRTR
ncbi:MAG: hypothetical protein N2037_12680, partial [Acidimicrobiales bacterium]|nr:hypothetical protein [Acidimicrobiales bacterium]